MSPLFAILWSLACGVAGAITTVAVVVSLDSSQPLEPGEFSGGGSAMAIVALFVSAPLGFMAGLTIGAVAWMTLAPKPKDAE